MIKFIVIVNRLGQICVAKYYESLKNDEKDHVQSEIISRCLTRSENQCSFLEYRDYKLIYERHGSMCYIIGVDDSENELATLELIENLVRIMQRCFGSKISDETVLQNMEYVYLILDEMISDGRVMETNHGKVVGAVKLFSHTVS